MNRSAGQWLRAPGGNFANRLLLSGATATNTTDLEFASWQNNEPSTDGFGPPTV